MSGCCQPYKDKAGKKRVDHAGSMGGTDETVICNLLLTFAEILSLRWATHMMSRCIGCWGPRPTWKALISAWIKCNVFENIHMLWMDRWIQHRVTSTIHLLAQKNNWSWLNYLVPAGLQMISSPRPTWNCFKCVWEHSYAVDGQIYLPSCHLHHTWCPRIHISWQILGSTLSNK